jgi:hypothetical protein
MKRSLIAVVLVLALVPAPAAAATRHYTGRIDPGGTVSFDARVRQGTIKEVIGFAWEAMPMTCDEGSSTVGGQFKTLIDVAKAKFHQKGTTHGSLMSWAKVRGRFTKHGKKAHGTLREHGDFAKLTSCDTARLDWHAHQG